MRLRQKATRLIVALAIAVTAFLALVAGLFHYKARLATSLLSDLSNLQAGAPVADVSALVLRYHGRILEPQSLASPCISKACTYVFNLQTFIDPGKHERLSRLNGFLDHDQFGYFGLRLWQVFGEVHTGLDGRVKSIWTSVYLEGACHKSLTASWELGTDTFDREREWTVTTDAPGNLLVRWHSVISSSYGEGLTAYLTPSASADEREAAFGINPACLDRFGQGCFLLSDIFPGAVSWQRKHRWPLGWTDQTCHGIKDER